MMCLEFPGLESFCEEHGDLTFPEDMYKLTKLLKADGIKINCDLNTLEKLWFAFSTTWDAYFLDIHNMDENDTYPRFLKWVKGMDIDTADHMDYDGTVTNEVCRPWERKKED